MELNEERKKIAGEMRERLGGYIVGAFGFVAGMAWNDAIRSLIEYFFPLAKGADSIILKFVYAFIITVVIVLVSLYLLRFLKRENPPL